ncbi:MAG TPA: thioredoxin domain-containing protein, partial [Humisphaera sp.]|nr:thioredoxin domain-containing protein [Humisphaera sp.]
MSFSSNHRRIDAGALVLRAIPILCFILLGIWIRFATSACADEKPKSSEPQFTNRLAKEKSPYLLQHAHNPVDWYPWGQEAFDKAKKENKPIFLSIGYSTCHWCHVMERESFTNPEIAKLINENFIPIKVDREERPDVDAVYMGFIVATTGSGGWPMTVFLTPDREPFFGGTYFPPETKDDQPGLKDVLAKVHEVWTKDHDRLVASAARITAALKAATASAPAAGDALTSAVMDQAYRRFESEFDAAHPGFGRAPKFPRPVALNFLLHQYRRTGSKAALNMVVQNLHAMADGGIHDQIGGGFHRYSTDERWFCPHFEKMLYDQAQLASSYLNAYQITHEPFFAETARDILDYVLRDMTAPDGEFYSAEDADSATGAGEEKREGAFYVWKAAEIRTAIGAEAAGIFFYRFGVEDAGNVERDPRHEFTGKNILYIAHSIAECAKKFAKSEGEVVRVIADARRKLLAARAARPRPLRDDKTLAAWNGLMISAFARAGVILHEPRYLQAATKAAGFIETKLVDPVSHQLTRRWRDGQAQVPGFLEDYAFFIQAAIDLYETSADIHWLKLALDLQAVQLKLFADTKAGGFFKTTGDDPTVFTRPKDAEDEAEPSGNSIAAMNLLRLG